MSDQKKINQIARDVLNVLDRHEASPHEAISIAVSLIMFAVLKQPDVKIRLKTLLWVKNRISNLHQQILSLEKELKHEKN